MKLNNNIDAIINVSMLFPMSPKLLKNYIFLCKESDEDYYNINREVHENSMVGHSVIMTGPKVIK